MEIKGRKERLCLKKILVGDTEKGLSQKFKEGFSKMNPMSDDETYLEQEGIAEALEDDQISISTARRVASKLNKNDILEKVDEVPGSNKPKPVYKINKSKLRQEIVDSETYQEEMPLWRHVIDKNADF